MNNPFATLSVDIAADKREILLRVAAALREGRYDARAIAEAQKTLFDPTARAAAELELTLGSCGDTTSVYPETCGSREAPTLKLLV